MADPEIPKYIETSKPSFSRISNAISSNDAALAFDNLKELSLFLCDGENNGYFSDASKQMTINDIQKFVADPSETYLVLDLGDGGWSRLIISRNNGEYFYSLNQASEKVQKRWAEIDK